MKEIVLKLYEFDELSKDSQEKIIERERWNVMEQCMDAYSVDYKKSMKAFEDMTDTEVYDWEVGYERYDFSYEFKYKDPIYERPTDYRRDIFPENLCGKLLFRYINNNIMPHITKGKYYSKGKYIDGKYNYKYRRSRVILGYEDNCPLTGMCYDYYLLKPIIDYYDTWCTYPENFSLEDLIEKMLGDYIPFYTKKMRNDIHLYETLYWVSPIPSTGCSRVRSPDSFTELNVFDFTYPTNILG